VLGFSVLWLRVYGVVFWVCCLGFRVLGLEFHSKGLRGSGASVNGVT
jgi:hypothetical protein